MTTYIKFDALPDAGALTSSDIVPIEQSGVTAKTTVGALTTASGGVPEAPNDGVGYVRKDLGWVAEAAGVFPVAIQAACSDETTVITTGAAKVTFRAPYAFTLTDVRASLTTASSSGLPEFDIKMNGASLLTTQITIDATEKTSTTATTPPVIGTTAITDDAEITVDFNAVGTGATGVKITLIGTKP